MEKNTDSSYSICLRPAFTEALVNKLTGGQTINLIGKHGQGRRRTLDDVKRCLPDSILVLHVDMKSYRQSYTGFIEALWQQCANEAAAPDNLAGLLTALRSGARPTLLILHNFDVLRINLDLDTHYSPRFFDHLNNIKRRANMSLLVVSEKAHSAFLQQGGGGDLPGSTLDANDLVLPEVS